MRIAVECCGAAQQWCGALELELELHEPATVGDALDALAARYGELAARRRTIAVALGETVVRAQQLLAPGDRLALIPPVSGG